jgi:hypothetical protein
MVKKSNWYGSAAYKIKVRGQLDQNWTDWFGEFNILTEGETTILTGVVKDQAELHGLLSRIRDLGLPLLFLERK